MSAGAASERVGGARTALFVPGDRPERFEKAIGAGADAVIVDLEDAVPGTRKEFARAQALDLLARPGKTPVWVRMNALDSRDGREDLAALATCSYPVIAMIPKASDPRGLGRLVAQLPPGSCIVPLIESASGVGNCNAIAGVQGVARLAFGHLDFCAELGLTPTSSELLWPARFALIVASAAAGLPAPIDGVSTQIHDHASVEAEARQSVAAGFGAKLCIHPAQIAAVHEGLAPSPEEVSWALGVVAALDGLSVAYLAGEMVDRPVLSRAEGILSRRLSQGRASKDE